MDRATGSVSRNCMLNEKSHYFENTIAIGERGDIKIRTTETKPNPYPNPNSTYPTDPT